MAKKGETMARNEVIDVKPTGSKSSAEWSKLLKKNSGYVEYKEKEEKSEILQSPSPGINYLFGKKQGIQAGYSALIYGPPKSGKSLFSLAFAGYLHKTDPEAIVLHFDTEFRETVPTWAKSFGIDMNRIFTYSTNDPTAIFDFIANDVKAMLQQGAPIKMIIIDSLEMINYPKEANAESSTNHIIGDASAYLKRAMKMILPVIRQHKLYSFLTQHVRMQMDPNKAKYHPWVVPGGVALKHSVEYWLACQKVESKDTKVFDSDKRDGSGNFIQTGHTIRVKMEENSLGPQNRSVEVHLSYADGIVNQHLEIAELAKNMGIVERPNDRTYVWKDKKWIGFDNFALAIKEDHDLQKELLDKIKEVDLT